MSLKLKPYPDCTDSGLPWLGRIPPHWEIWQIGHIAKVGNGCTPSRGNAAYWSDGEYPWLNSATVTLGTITKTNQFVTALALRECHLPRVKPGSVLVAITGQGKTRGKAAVLEIEATINQHIAFITPGSKRLYSPYLKLLLEAAYHELRSISDGSGGTKGALTCQDIKAFKILLPPADEQAAISRFLEVHGRMLRRLIRAKRRLIELLKEQKQVISHNAVTRGLDPNVPLKPSGIRWLEEMPQHWEMAKLKHLASMKSGDSITALSINEFGEYPVYGGNGLRGYTSSYSHDGSFVLIGRQGALCGNVHLVRGRFWASEHAVVTTLKPRNNIEWFAALLKTMNLNQYSESAAQPGLSVLEIQNLFVPVPTISEQNLISAYILKINEVLDVSIYRATREIDLLREYRTRLIADVVTGKLDVRGVQLPTIDEDEITEDLESLDEPDPDEIDDFEESADDDD